MTKYHNTCIGQVTKYYDTWIRHTTKYYDTCIGHDKLLSYLHWTRQITKIP